MKKIISVMLVAMIVFASFAMSASADRMVLKFNDNGKFVIANICDIQDGYPMNKTTKQYITEMLQTIKPDIVILGGDNCVAGLSGDDEYTLNSPDPSQNGKKTNYNDIKDEYWNDAIESEYILKAKTLKENAIKEICDIFVSNKTYFTLVFGNHDHQQFGRNSEKNVEENKEFLLSLYQKYGDVYCLAYDADKTLFGVGTHNLPIYSSDESSVKFNLYMFDSNTYLNDGYDAVHNDQIEWYKGVAATLKSNNGGKVVPAMAFQHIIVQEIYDELFIETPFSAGAIGEDFEGDDFEGVKHFIYLPKVANLIDGYLFEKPCPGCYNYGELDAMVETGDVLAIYSGHDHTNNFTTEIDGIKVCNTAGCTYHSYGDNLNRGARIIELNENDINNYNDYTYTVAKACLEDGSKICDFGDITKTAAKLSIFGGKLLDALMYVVKLIFFFVK